MMRVSRAATLFQVFPRIGQAAGVKAVSFAHEPRLTAVRLHYDIPVVQMVGHRIVERVVCGLPVPVIIESFFSEKQTEL